MHNLEGITGCTNRPRQSAAMLKAANRGWKRGVQSSKSGEDAGGDAVNRNLRLTDEEYAALKGRAKVTQ